MHPFQGIILIGINNCSTMRNLAHIGYISYPISRDVLCLGYQYGQRVSTMIRLGILAVANGMSVVRE